MAQTTQQLWRTGGFPVEPSTIVSRPRRGQRMEASSFGGIDTRIWVASVVTICAAFVFAILGSQLVPWALGIAPGPMMANPVTPFILSIALVLLAWRRASDLGKAALAQREADRRVRELAYVDEVTGLYNRRFLVNSINSKNDRGLVLILLDLDDFKKVNDRHGYAAGDDLLRDVAEQLVKVSDGATCARLGADEFAVLLEGAFATEEYGRFLASELLAELTQSATLADDVASVGVSIGVSQGAPNESAASLMQRADKAMHEAKRLGSNRVHAFFPEMATS